MDVQIRRHRTVQIQDQENIHAVKAKSIIPTSKRLGLGVRGALGEINSNIQVQKDDTVNKIAVTAAEFEKKATISRGGLRSNTYKHVQSKVNTGLASKPVAALPSSRPPLRREESTAGHAARAIARIKVAATIKEKSLSKENIAQGSQKDDKKALKKSDPALKPKESSLVKIQTKKDTRTLERPVEESSPELPQDIEDIDAGDEENPFLMSGYIKDIYKYLTELELKYRIEPDHLAKQAIVTGKMRATLIDWLVEVHRQFNLLLETFHLTVGIIDRYLQCVHSIKRNQLQLIGVSAMFIASKYEEIYAPEIGDFVYVTDNAYTKHDIFKCERDIISKLGFCLGRPLPLHFLRRFVKAASGNAKNHHLAKYLVDLCLVEYSMAHYRPSELAAAAMCLSLFLLSNSRDLKDTWTPTLSYYSGYSFRHIAPIVAKVAAVLSNVDSCKHKAVQQRYEEASLARVSTLPQLKNPVILEIAQLKVSPSS